ncbi:MAG: hypothetical protein IJF59_02520 [Clostridia bacterium]|nr:hypothetical protein [Clostridia bacterium]MBQ3077578.1 hypothetical protein [Clostridia bacterium]
MRIAHNLLMLVLLIALIVWLQMFLSRRESRWPGLLLPFLSFLYSLLYPLNYSTFGREATFVDLMKILLIWLIANAPTAILLAIYSGCREKHRRRRQLDKMSAHDLDG